jgi:hypothetical protein
VWAHNGGIYSGFRGDSHIVENVVLGVPFVNSRSIQRNIPSEGEIYQSAKASAVNK